MSAETAQDWLSWLDQPGLAPGPVAPATGQLAPAGGPLELDPGAMVAELAKALGVPARTWSERPLQPWRVWDALVGMVFEYRDALERVDDQVAAMDVPLMNAGLDLDSMGATREVLADLIVGDGDAYEHLANIERFRVAVVENVSEVRRVLPEGVQLPAISW